MLGAHRLQVTSVEDFSTNYCNLRNLYCELVVAKAPVLASLLSACLLPCHVSAFILAYQLLLPRCPATLSLSLRARMTAQAAVLTVASS